MAPPCTGLKGFSSLNRIKAPDAWHRRRSVSTPLGELAGQIALHQLRAGRHFIVENPRGSELYELPAWIQVAKHSRT
eukprot:1282633-Prorocentrum_lima.AAC.1